MGIKGLKKIIKANAPGSISEIDIKSLRGSTICIDSSILLYKFRYRYSSDNFHVLGFLNKVVELLSYRIVPVFVFDGKPPDAKRETLLKRVDNRTKLKERIEKLKETIGNFQPEYIDTDSDCEEAHDPKELLELSKELGKLEKNVLTVTKKHSQEVMELLKSIGIPFLLADGEAEEYCAFLQKNKYVDYILTEDTDSLTFGSKSVLFGNPKNKTKFYLCTLDTVLNEMNITFNQFVDFCILCGCDYTCTIPKIGPVTALKLIKTHGNIESVISQNNGRYSIPENFNYSLSRELFNQNSSFERLNDPELYFTSFDNESFNSVIVKFNINSSFKNKIINLINLFPKKFLDY